jgi:hypothetical protein
MRRTLLAALGILASLAACRGPEPAQGRPAPAAAAAATAPAPAPAAASARRRDLSADEAMGGHTLARHVGRTDAELADRLRREPQISAASTWTDRDSAERAVGAALDGAAGRLAAWERRSGRRPNLVLHYTDRAGATLGRSLSRAAPASVACTQALVVLRWDDRRDRFFVLTAYPEADR